MWKLSTDDVLPSLVIVTLMLLTARIPGELFKKEGLPGSCCNRSSRSFNLHDSKPHLIFGS
jgi:hypothetical protein